MNFFSNIYIFIIYMYIAHFLELINFSILLYFLFIYILTELNFFL